MNYVEVGVAILLLILSLWLLLKNLKTSSQGKCSGCAGCASPCADGNNRQPLLILKQPPKK